MNTTKFTHEASISTTKMSCKSCIQQETELTQEVFQGLDSDSFDAEKKKEGVGWGGVWWGLVGSGGVRD